MQIDLLTLYCLIIGTLLVAAAMTLWERQAKARRSRELGMWATSYLVFAAGCFIGLNRGKFPGVTGGALANLVIVLGYLLVLHGAVCLDGGTRAVRSALVIPVLALLWTTLGAQFPGAFWTYVASLPIALICGLTAWTILRSRALQGLRSRPIALAISAGHGGFYLFRALISPLLVVAYGDGLLPTLAVITMYEGVLYSVAMPMAFLALVREEAQNELLATSRTDYLTGLVNRQGFFEQGARALSRHDATQPMSILAFDLDHFKAINDRHGHAVGDEVLKLFARAARRITVPDAILARLGGEEFAALLPGQSASAARQVGESVAQLFAAKAARHDGLAIRATVSIGLAEVSSGQADLSELLSAADRALYQAKALGRNRIEVAKPAGIAA